MHRRQQTLVLFFLIFSCLTAATSAEPATSDKADKPAANAPAAGTPSADKQAADTTTADKPTPDKSTPDKAAPDKSAADKPAADKPAKESSTPAAPTYTVKREPFKIQIELDGLFESREMSEIVLHPEEWSTFPVAEAVEHGTRMKKGDVLITFDSEKIDRAIDDLRAEQRLAEVALKQAEDQLAVLEKTTPMDLEASQRAQRIAEEDQKQYLEVGRPLRIKMSEFQLKVAKQSLEYQRQELEQLEKMYKADDLTEETEEIVLKRQRDAVERAEFNAQREEVEYDQSIKYQVPRTDEQIKETAKRKTLTRDKDQVELPLALENQRLEVKKQKVQLQRSKERLKNLLADQKLMKITAPCDGYVYYGRCQRGKFTEIAAMTEALGRGDNAPPHRVLMTIVEPRPIFIHATLAEEHLQHVRKDMDGTAAPAGYPDIKLDVTVDELSKAPVAFGSFDLQLSLNAEQPPKVLMPGMACNIKLVPYSKPDALTIPTKLLITDPLDDDKHFVYLQTKDGKSEKKDVTIGKKSDKQVEILKGLSEGDKILPEPPKDDK